VTIAARVRVRGRRVKPDQTLDDADRYQRALVASPTGPLAPCAGADFPHVTKSRRLKPWRYHPVACLVAVIALCAQCGEAAMSPRIKRMPLPRRFLIEITVYGILCGLPVAAGIGWTILRKLFGQAGSKTDSGQKGRVEDVESKWKRYFYRCPHCGAQRWAYAYMSGRHETCRACNRAVVIPDFGAGTTQTDGPPPSS